MANITSDEDKYADESFEADSDVSTSEDKTDEPSDSEVFQAPRRMPHIKNNALLASTQARQMKLNSQMGSYPINRDVLPYGSSDDDDDVVYSHTVAQVNSEFMLSDSYHTPSSGTSRRSSASENRHKLKRIIEVTENEIDLSLSSRHRENMLPMLEPQESHFVSDVSEELEMDMEMLVKNNETVLRQHPESSRYAASEFSSKPTSPKSEQNASMRDLASKIQEMSISQGESEVDLDAVVRMVTEAMSKFNTEPPANNQMQQKKPPHTGFIKPPFKLPGEIKRILPNRTTSNQNMGNSKTSGLSLKGGRSYTVLPSETDSTHAQEEAEEESYEQHNYTKEDGAELEENIDSPRSQKSSDHSYKMENMPTLTETETAVETDADLRFYEPKVKIRSNNNNSLNSYRSDMSLPQSKAPSRHSSNHKFMGTMKQGQSVRKSWSFSNERMRQIERENRILLEKILTQKPTIPMTRRKTPKYNYLPPTTFTTKSAIDRKKLQRQIDLDNQVLKNKIESVSYRRRPISFKSAE